jgi:cell division septal protein FtsQ
MEIKTRKSPKEQEESDAPPAPDKSMYLRKKVTPQIRKSYLVSRLLIKGLKVLAQAAVCLAAIALLIWVGFYAYSSDRFTLQTISFYGCKHLDCRGLEAAIRRDFPKHILRIDLTQLRGRIEKEVWTRRAEIRRILPSELAIYVQERTPLVIMEVRNDLMLGDEDGILLDKYDPGYGKLDVPVFKGLLGDNPEGYRLYQEENSERVRLGLKMLAELESGSPEYTRSISEVDLSDKSNLRAMLVDDTAEISFGDRDFLKRFNKLMANMNQYRDLKTQYGEFASVDLRFEDQIAYRPRKGRQNAQPAELRK